jgi:hypothetical protein
MNGTKHMTLLLKMKLTLRSLLCTIWCHRVTYAGLALAYGAGCLGVIEKETVAQIATALYCTMVAQRH